MDVRSILYGNTFMDNLRVYDKLSAGHYCKCHNIHAGCHNLSAEDTL